MPQLRPALDGVGAPTGPPSPRAALFWDGTYWRMAAVDAGGRLQVRGEDQLISYEENLVNGSYGVISGAGGFHDSLIVPAGEIWNVLTITVRDSTSPVTQIRVYLRTGGGDFTCLVDRTAMAAGQHYSFATDLWLDPTDRLRIYFVGALAADNMIIELTGKIMTLEV